MRRLVLLPLAAALLSLAACSGGPGATASTGGGGASPAATPSAAGSAGSAGGSAAAGGGAACAAAAAGSTATVTVTIKDFKFAPQPVQAKVGDIVQWTNQDSAQHTATLDNGACDTKSISNGASAMLVFNQPGTYTYHCAIHPAQMKDYTVVVQ